MTYDTLHHLLLLSQDTGHLLQATGHDDNIQGLRSHSPSLDQVAQYLHINIAFIMNDVIAAYLLSSVQEGFDGVGLSVVINEAPVWG